MLPGSIHVKENIFPTFRLWWNTTDLMIVVTKSVAIYRDNNTFDIFF